MSEINSSWLSRAKRIDRLCDDFEAAWKAAHGVRIEDFLPQLSQSDREAALPSLVLLEIELRARNGETPDRPDYQHRFPEYHSLIERALAQGGPRESASTDRASFIADGQTPREPIVGSAASVAIPPLRDFGDYVLIEQIARGGMGVVYKARQKSLNRTVALKMIVTSQFLDERDVRRFVTEAQATAQLDHPSIVPIFEIGQCDGQHYYTMAFVEGRSLAHRIVGQPFPPAEAARIMIEVAEAISYAHERGVIHRDLKPGNVLLDGNGQAKVADFGLAKNVRGNSDLTATGLILGTPCYMSPEQAQGKAHHADYRTDVYSLGVILFELLTGDLPFRGQEPMLAVQIIHDESPAPRSLNASVPRDLETICLKCLEKDPSRRYQTAREFAEELRRYARGEPIRTRAVTTVERSWRWCKRNPVTTSLSAALLLALCGGLLGVFVQWRRAEYHAAVATAKADEATRFAAQATLKADQETKARGEMQVALYNASMLSMPQLEEAGSYSPMLRTIESLRPEAGQPDLRDFAWRHWWTRLHQHSRIVGRGVHSETHKPIRLSSDGNTIAWRANETTINVAEYPGGGNVRQSRHKKAVQLGEFITGMDTLVTFVPARAGTTVHFWTLADGWLESTLEVGPLIPAAHDQSARWDSAAISAGGKWLVCRRDTASFDVWNLTERKLSHEGFKEPVQFASLSADGRVLATVTEDGVFTVWDLVNGSRQELQRYSHPLRHEAFVTPDGKYVLCTCGSKSSLFRVADGLQLRESPGWPLDTAVSGDGKLIAIANNSAVRIWSLDSGQEVAAFDHRMRIEKIALSHTGSLLIAGGWGNRLHAWDVQSRRSLADFPAFDGWIRHVGLSPDGRQVIACDNAGDRATIKSWDVNILQDPWRRRDTFDLAAHAANVGDTEKVSDLEFTPDGRLLLSAANETSLAVWDTHTGLLRRRIDCGGEQLSHLSIDPTGAKVASTTLSRGKVTLGVWEIESGTKLNEIEAYSNGGYFNRKAPVAFVDDGQKLVTGAELTSDVKLWDAETLELIGSHRLPRPSSYEFAVFPGSRMFVEASTHWVVLRDELTGRQMQALTPGGYDVAVSRDGRYIAVGSSSVQVWETATMQVKHSFTAHGQIKALAFSPDTHSLALSAVEDKAVRIYNLLTGAIVARFAMPDACYALVFSPDGDLLACGCMDGTIRFLTTTPPGLPGGEEV